VWQAMLDQGLAIKVESKCMSLWKEPWAKRRARVTLLVDFDDHFVRKAKTFSIQ
jgi:hypothetical protein